MPRLPVLWPGFCHPWNSFFWNQELHPLSPGFCLLKAHVAPRCPRIIHCVSCLPRGSLSLRQTGAAHPLRHPGLHGSRPPAHTQGGGGQLQEVLCLFPPCALQLVSCFFTHMMPTCFGLHLDQGMFFPPFISPASGGFVIIICHSFCFSFPTAITGKNHYE